MHLIPLAYRVVIDAFYRSNADDGKAIASVIALSGLMSMFPFLILVTGIVGFIGSENLAAEVARMIVEAWPAKCRARSPATSVMCRPWRAAACSPCGAVFAIYFASSGVESLRIGLNRAYGLTDPRPWWLLRLDSIGYVLVAAVGLLALSFLVVLGPLVFRTALAYMPWLAEIESHFNIGRFVIATILLVTSLLILHMWLPAGRRQFAEVWPGIVATLVMWLTCGFVFGRYLSNFSYTYVTYYAGLASAMMALVFLYFTALIFIYGGELNAAIARLRQQGSELPLS